MDKLSGTSQGEVESVEYSPENGGASDESVRTSSQEPQENGKGDGAATVTVAQASTQHVATPPAGAIWPTRALP